MTPEGKVKKEVKKVLNRYYISFHCPVQAGFGTPSLDFIGCHCGRYLAIETKAPGKKPTPRQVNTAKEITRCGGKVFVIDSTENTDTYADLEDWIIAIGGEEYERLAKENKGVEKTPDDIITVE